MNKCKECTFLEDMKKYYKCLMQLTNELNNIKDFLTRLEQVDLEEYEHDLKVYERVTNCRGQAFRDVLNILKEDL